jgi:hypothetical protein
MMANGDDRRRRRSATAGRHASTAGVMGVYLIWAKKSVKSGSQEAIEYENQPQEERIRSSRADARPHFLVLVLAALPHDIVARPRL